MAEAASGQTMTIDERRAFLEKNEYWLGDLVIKEGVFYDFTSGWGMADEEVLDILADRMQKKTPWVE